MKPSVKMSLVLLSVTSLLNQNIFAGDGNSSSSNSNSNSSSSSSSSQSSKYVSPFTAADVEAFTSTFSTIPPYPADYSWDSLPAPTTSSKPIVPSFSQPPVIPVVTAGLASDGSLDIASLASLGYEGVRCAAGIYKFPYQITDTYGVSQNKILETELPQAAQSSASSLSEQTVACSQKIPAVTGKAIKGNIVFQCQAGLWRIKQVGCTDTETSCNGGTSLVNVPSSYGTFPTNFNVPAGKYLDGAAAGVYSCKSVLPVPQGTGTQVLDWSGNINLSCNGGNFSAASQNCQVFDKNDNVYPNCGSGVIGYYQQTSSGSAVLARACFPAGTSMAQINITGSFGIIVARSVGPNVYHTGSQINTNVPFFWVKKDLSTLLMQEYLGCGKYTYTTNYFGTITTTGFGMTTTTSCSPIGIMGCTGTTSTAYSIQPVACPQ